MQLTSTFPYPARYLQRRSNLILEKASNHPLFLVMVHWLCLAAVGFPYWQFIGVYILAATFYSMDRVRLLSGMNIAFFLVTGGLLSITSPSIDSEIEFWRGTVVSVVGSALLVAAIYFLLFQLMIRIRALRRPVTVCLAVLVLLGAATLTPSRVPFVNVIVVATFFAMIRVFWSFCYQLSEIDLLRTRPFLEHLGTLAFPWQFGWASPNIVRGYSDLKNAAPESDESFKRAQISGVKLMVYALISQLAAQGFSYVIFSHTENGGEIQFSPLSTYMGWDFSTTGYLSLSLSTPASWLFVICTAIYFVLMLSATTNAAVSIARMCGFMVFRHVYKPLEATSFNGFLGRMYYYYIAILLRFLFYPLWSFLRPVRVRRLRIFLTNFLTILGGGFLTTGLRYAPFTVDWAYRPLVDLVWFRWPYFVALATLSGLSAIMPSWPVWPRLARYRGCGYFLLYALCYALQIRHWDSTIGEAWHAFLHLFFL